MELRRALLLFVIVLGLAAIVSSIARPPSDDRSDDADSARSPARTPADADASPSASARPSGAVPTIEVGAGDRATRTARIEPGRPATLLVQVGAPGQVEIPALGLVQPAEPLTPARFDVLVARPGSHRIVFRPASSTPATTSIGTLSVRAAK